VRQGYISEIFVSFQGEGAHVGERHLFVRLAGCNIRCTYCDTPDSLERTPGYRVYDKRGDANYSENPISSAALAEIVQSILRSDPYIDALALTGGEPLVQSEFLREFLNMAQLQIPVLLETNGVLPQRLAPVLDGVSIISMDFKLPSNSGEAPFWDEHASFLDQACRAAKDVYVKILVDAATELTDVARAGSLLAQQAAEITAFLQPISDPPGGLPLSEQRLAEMFGTLRAQHRQVRVLPQTHKLIGIR
jgi:organic radical activating enzyme